MDKIIHILILEDVVEDAELIERELRKAGLLFSFKHVGTKETFLKEIEEFKPDIILVDYKLPQIDGLTALRLVKEYSPSIPVIIVTGTLSDEEAVECMKAGAVDYVLKDRLSRLGPAVANVIELKKKDEEEKRIKEQLKKSELRYQSLFEGMLNGFAYCQIIVDENNKPIDWIYRAVNHAFEKITKLKKDIIGKKVTEVIPGIKKDVPELFEIYGKVALAGEESKFEIYLDTIKTWYYVSASCPQEGYFITIFDDITERKKKDEELLKLYRAVEQSPSSIVITDKDGAIEYVNPKFTQLTGYTSEEVIGKNPRILKSGQQTPEFYKQLWDTIASGKEWRGEFQNKKKTGELYWESASISSINNSAGVLTHFIAIKEDITQKKQMEQILLQSEKMASIGTLAAGIAHEINNPIAYIDSNLKAIRKNLTVMMEFCHTIKNAIEAHSKICSNGDTYLSDIFVRQKEKLNIEYFLTDTGDAVNESLEGTEKVKRIVTDLRDFSRSEKPEMKLANINDGLDKTINIVWNELKYKAEVIKEYGTIPEIECDIHKLEQVFMNILVNAAHAIEKNGVIKIKTLYRDDFIIIQISDTGKGIPPENLKRIFDAFFTTKETGKGTGLGLSIAYKIIQDHKGTINVESEIGKGTTFTIKLPVNKSISSKEYNILIVDDEIIVRDLLKKNINNYNPLITVYLAKGGFEAADLLHSFKFEVVLLDINMPGIDGFEVCNKIKHDEITKNTKVIIISGLEASEFREKSIEAGAMEFLEKPISSKRLFEVLDKIFKY